MPDDVTTPKALAAWSLLAIALDPLAPAPQARQRLLELVCGEARYLPFCAALAEHFDLSAGGAESLLVRATQPDAWTQGLEPILGFLHFRPGPRLAGAHCGLVRLKRGTRIPAHRHKGRELTFVLEGRLIDDRARELRPGELLDMPPGSVHVLGVAPESDALVAVKQADIEMIGI